MRLSINNGCIVADWEGKPKKEFYTLLECWLSMTEKERAFVDSCRYGDYDLGQPSIDLRFGAYKFSSKPYQAYFSLAWVCGHAKKHGIELEESYTELYDELSEEYNRIYNRCEEERAQRLTALAESRWSEMDKTLRTSCKNCYCCKGVIDGDLYCDKYKKDLDVAVGEGHDRLSGTHMMFASHGIPLAECQEDERKQLEKEKEDFINDFVYGYGWWAVNDEVEKIMNKGEQMV